MDARVEREKAAHDQNGVLEAAYRLKERFPHVSRGAMMKRCNQDFDRLTRATEGQRVLEVGCGFGDQCIERLHQGAQVVGIDISDRYIEAAKAATGKAGFPESAWEFRVMDAHNLQYDSQSFDLVFGRGILHHLDLSRSVSEVHRVLKSGGAGVFLEPLADNPLLKLFRFLTPRARTVDEQPLRRLDLNSLARSYSISYSFYGLVAAPLAMFTSVVLRPWPENFLLKQADVLDKYLSSMSKLGPLGQYVILSIGKS